MKFNTIAKIFAVILFGGTVAACSSSPGPKEAGGTLVGAVVGNDTTGTSSGVAAGGLIGNRIGAGLDDEDKHRAYAAQVQALESGPSGAPVAWRNPGTGSYGSVVPGTAYQREGLNCRPYTHTIYIDGQPQTARGAACRNPDGVWDPV